jgi:hypothetical protein
MVPSSVRRSFIRVNAALVDGSRLLPQCGIRRGKEGWQEKHNPEAAGPVRTMSFPYDLISRKILF